MDAKQFESAVDYLYRHAPLGLCLWARLQGHKLTRQHCWTVVSRYSTVCRGAARQYRGDRGRCDAAGATLFKAVVPPAEVEFDPTFWIILGSALIKLLIWWWSQNTEGES